MSHFTTIRATHFMSRVRHFADARGFGTRDAAEKYAGDLVRREFGLAADFAAGGDALRYHHKARYLEVDARIFRGKMRAPHFRSDEYVEYAR